MIKCRAFKPRCLASWPAMGEVTRGEGPMRTAAVAGLVVMTIVGVRLEAQTPASDEQQIRAQIQRLDAGASAVTNVRQDLYTDTSIGWSNRTKHPSGFYKDREAVRADLTGPLERNNMSQKTTPERIVISKGGDMAYEYSTFALSFEDERGPRRLEGAALRVWQKEGADWKIAAAFQRPY